MAEKNITELVGAMRSVDKNKLSLAERLELLSAAKGLIAEVERPWDTILRMIWGEPSIYACIRTLVDLKLFEKWVEAGDEPKTPEELGRMVGCDPHLMERLIRNVASAGLVANPKPYTYGLTEFSRSLADKMGNSPFRYLYDVNLPIYASMPSYLAHGGYRDLSGKPVTSTVFNWSKSHTGDYFSYLAEHPSQNEDFGHCMRGWTSNTTRWTEQYPTQKLLDGDDSNDDVVVVDMGGSTGHDINAFQEKHNLSPGRLILQDLPEVVEKAQVVDGVKAMPHDFFTPQPVKGARAYYLHSILHDWPDDKAREILDCLKPALKKGHSKVLLHEMIIWPQGNVPLATHTYILMMSAFNAAERTIEAWKKLIEPAGFKISEVYTSPTSPQSILELELV